MRKNFTYHSKKLFYRKIFFRLFIIFILILETSPAIAVYKLQASYSIPKKIKKLKLRVTEIPKEFDWIDKDLDGKTVLPKKNSIIIFESIEDIELTSIDGQPSYLPSGTKFWAKLNSVSSAKSFNRDGKINLDFFQAQTPANPKTNIEAISYNSGSNPITKTGSVLKDLGAYAIGGALAAPLITFSISGSGLMGLGLLLNPYTLAGVSALGGSAGLAYGIHKQGSQRVLEPGTEIQISLKETWKFNEIAVNAPPQNSKPSKQEFDFNILKITKTKDVFEDKALKILISYQNFINEKLFYNNFVLVDSMGKEYYPSNQRADDYSLDGLPSQGTLELVFASDFLKAVHHLQVRKNYNQKIIAEQKIILK